MQWLTCFENRVLSSAVFRVALGKTDVGFADGEAKKYLFYCRVAVIIRLKNLDKPGELAGHRPGEKLRNR